MRRRRVSPGDNFGRRARAGPDAGQSRAAPGPGREPGKAGTAAGFAPLGRHSRQYSGRARMRPESAARLGWRTQGPTRTRNGNCVRTRNGESNILYDPECVPERALVGRALPTDAFSGRTQRKALRAGPCAGGDAGPPARLRGMGLTSSIQLD